MRKYVAEATGAFFIVVSLGISTDAIGIGFTFAALYMIFSGTSGGHFNPAVSLAFLIKRDITPKQFGGYFLSQTVGVFLGAALILYLSGFVVYAEPPSSTNLYQQSIIEFLMTFVLVMVYLKTKTTRMEQNRILNAVILGITRCLEGYNTVYQFAGRTGNGRHGDIRHHAVCQIRHTNNSGGPGL